MNTKISLAIDLGTTYSTASGIADGHVQEFAFPGNGPQIPSAVYFLDEDDFSVLAGMKAMKAEYKQPEHLFTCPKRRMNAHGSGAKYSNVPASSNVNFVNNKMRNRKKMNRAK